MGFFDGIKIFKNNLSKVEKMVQMADLSLSAVYERNAQLEAEIIERTKELDVANRQMLTLQHILNMMNSSKPLSTVLNAVVNNLQGELGYLHSCIVKKCDDGGEYLQLMASNKELAEILGKYFKSDPSEIRLNIVKDIEDYSHVKEEIFHSEDIFSLLSGALSNLDKRNIEKEIMESKIKSYMIVPLSNKKVNFGSLVVFSSREEVTDNELNFLKLFARQIELALTIADLFQAVKEQAITDSMTGLYNRRYFEDFLKKEVNRANRQHQCFTIIGLDLDHLKEINDNFGHNYGDLAIKTIAKILKNSCRSIDIAARMGGEEFNLILPGINSKGGVTVAERIRKAIENTDIEKIGQITASVGVATYFEHSEDIDELIELVDHAMYESKQNGRNRTTVAKATSVTSWQEIAIDTFINILSKHRIPLDEKTTEVLNKKLTKMDINNDEIYQISDMLVSTYNPNHSQDSTKKKIIFATLLAKRFELPKENIDKLKIALLLYDIGNTLLPKDLLLKKEPLTEEEKLDIKKHPIIAAREILTPISNVVDIIPIIEKHHENWNGTGYPNNLSGEEIPLESQIILIIDSYFALLETRPYRPALSKQEAITTILEEIGAKWNEKLANEFATIINDELD